MQEVKHGNRTRNILMQYVFQFYYVLCRQTQCKQVALAERKLDKDYVAQLKLVNNYSAPGRDIILGKNYVA